jgi:hypothetical protein
MFGKVGPHISAAFVAGFAEEPRLDIGEPEIIRPRQSRTHARLSPPSQRFAQACDVQLLQ